MSLHQLNKMVGKVAKALYDSEKFPVVVLAGRLRTAAEEHPEDAALVAMHNFLNRRLKSEPLITRAELRDVYERLYSTNTKCASFLSEELGSTANKSTPHVMKHDSNEGKEFKNVGDAILRNAFDSAFENKPLKLYSSKVAELAARTCLHELNRFVAPLKIDVVAGQEDVLICQASYETPKGMTSVFVPVEIRNNKALLPTVFLSHGGFADLTKEALEDYVVTTAGKKMAINPQKLLTVVATAKNGLPEQPSELDVIIAKARAAKGTIELPNAILGQKMAEIEPDLEMPKMAEAEDFGKRLSSPAGAAELLFGKTALKSGYSMVVKALQTLGYEDARVVVADANQDTIFFAVSVDNKNGFKVPVKIANKQPQQPKFVIASGSLHEFSKSGLNEVLAGNDFDGQMVAMASAAYGLKSNELIAQVEAAMYEGNVVLAEDSLNVLRQSGDEVSYKMALAIYMDGLGGKLVKQASCCDKQRTVAHSKHVICGHTNLPVHKVYQDKNGYCQPLYRKYIAEPEGGSFMHSKIFI